MPRPATLAFLLLAAPAFAAGTRFKTSDDQAMKAFRLTTENVRKAAAVTRRLLAEVAKDPALARSAEKRGEHADTLDAKAMALESEPRIASALRAESISAREYVMVHLAALQAGMVAAMKAKGVQLDAAQIGEAMNPANVEFLETHPRRWTIWAAPSRTCRKSARRRIAGRTNRRRARRSEREAGTSCRASRSISGRASAGSRASPGSPRLPSPRWRSAWGAALPCSASSTRRCCGPCLTGRRSGSSR